MRTKCILLLLIPILWNCKQKVEKTAEPISEEVQEVQKLPSEIFEIAEFAEVTLPDSTNVDNQIRFLSIDGNESIDSLNLFEAIDLYKKWIGSGESDVHPIFEMNESGDIVVIVANRGYGGNIRGTLLINKSSLEIKKVKFDHKAESEGYGAAITNASFEDQFLGTKVNFEKNTFGLNQDGANLIKGDKMIDGLSGATITSRLTVQMINEELKKYKKYFKINESSL